MNLKYFKESIRLFSWSNLRFFLLAGLNNFIRSVKCTIIFGWWLIPMLLVPIFNLGLKNTDILTSSLDLVVIVTSVCMLTSIYILCCRPSLERKDRNYFWIYLSALPGLFILTFLHNILPGLGVILLLAAFFSVDSKINLNSFFKSISHSIKFFIYFFVILIPFMLFDWLLFSFLNFSAALTYAILTALNLGVSLLLLFFQISLLSVFYIRIRHTYPDLFVEK